MSTSSEGKRKNRFAFITFWLGLGENHVYVFFFLIFKKRFYLFIHERERERQRHRQREKQAPCREPDVGFDLGSPGSCPGLKAALNREGTQAALFMCFNAGFLHLDL